MFRNVVSDHNYLKMVVCQESMHYNENQVSCTLHVVNHSKLRYSFLHTTHPGYCSVVLLIHHPSAVSLKYVINEAATTALKPSPAHLLQTRAVNHVLEHNHFRKTNLSHPFLPYYIYSPTSPSHAVEKSAAVA